MSEQRFLLDWDMTNILKDGKPMIPYDVVVCLNEQQSTITELKEENEQLKEELNNLKKDETMLYHYYTLARYGGDGV